MVNPKCETCGKTCYPAEKTSMEGRIFHNKCLRCTECTKILDGSNWGGFLEGKDPYCKIHLTRLIQTAGGGGNSSSVSQWTPKETTGKTTPSRFGGGAQDKCTDCGKTVYPAEKQSMEGRIYHYKCLKCKECGKILDGSNWGGFIPPDSNDGFCKVHRDQYIRTIGGAAPASSLQWTPKANAGSATPSKFGGGQREKCERCGKSVYPAERVSLEKRVFHGNCIRCCECNKTLTGANFGNFIGDGSPEDKAYCKVHYDRVIATLGDATKISGSTKEWTGGAN